jgi:glycosyltransferase involved in cell wall biosynthesis
MPKIAINVSPIFDGNSLRGVGYYTENLIKAIKKEIKNNSKYKGWSIRLIKKKSSTKTGKYDLIHYPFFDPFKLTLSIDKYTPTVATIHDLIPIQFKTHFPVGIKGNLKWLVQKNKAKRLSQIITVSNYSKKVINQIIKYPLDKITATHLAADSSFKKITNKKKLASIQKKYKLPDKFIFFVGDINWNKNIPNLVKAFQQLGYPLVIAGSSPVKKNVSNHPWTKDLRWLQQQKIDNLIFTGFVPDEELPYLYNLATVYCQPSFAEGFGLPLVQAMQSTCPVAFSKSTCLPEVMNYHGLVFNPYSVESIKKALKKYWNDPKLRQKYSRSAFQYVKKFNWKYTARQTLSVYKLALLNEK